MVSPNYSWGTSWDFHEEDKKAMTAQSHQEAAIEFLMLVVAGKVREAYDRHIGPRFRHHNPFFYGDASSMREAMEQDAAENPGKILEVRRALQDGNQVAVLSHVRQKPDDPGFALVHIFRFEGHRIAELWDVGQALPKDSINENGFF
jgi:predicted SnoaL-like aldol condensation-catalyzing enzyme